MEVDGCSKQTTFEFIDVFVDRFSETVFRSSCGVTSSGGGVLMLEKCLCVFQSCIGAVHRLHVCT